MKAFSMYEKKAEVALIFEGHQDWLSVHPYRFYICDT